MIKIPTPKLLLSGALSVAVVCLFISLLSGCRSDEGGDNGKPQMNNDTLRHHAIPIEVAREWTRAFQASLDTNLRIRPKAADSVRFSHAEAFPSDVFYSLLAQQNEKQGKAKGIRIYFGRDTTGQLRVILVPVDSLGNDIINHLVNVNGKPVPGTAHVEAAAADGQGYEAGQICPTVCSSTASGLNK